MAQQPAEEHPIPSFTGWLRDMCIQGDISLRQLYVFFIRVGGDCSQSTMDRWMRGVNDPPASAAPLLVKALISAPSLKGAKVQEEYDRWFRSFKRAPRGNRGHLRAVPDGVPLATKA